MKHVTVTDMAQDKVITKQEFSERLWQTAIEPNKLSVVTVKPEELSLSGLYDYVHFLKASEQDSSRYELALWRKVTQSFSIAVMMLMALSFIFGPLRSVTMGARILSGVVAGFTFYISSEFLDRSALFMVSSSFRCSRSQFCFFEYCCDVVTA